MGKVSKTNSSGPRKFFEVVFENKHGWIGHVIPIRYWDSEFYQEGYLWSTGSSKTINGLMVLNAFLPLNRPSEKFVFKESLYPSARQIYKTKYNESIVEEDSSNPFDGCEKPNEIDLTKDNIIRFFDKYRDYFTIAEIKSCFALDELAGIEKNILNILNILKLDTNKKMCLITSKMETGYKLQEEKQIMTTQLSDKQDIKSIVEDYTNCKLCSLGESRIERDKKIIPYGGNINSVGMIIGEAPGRLEEENLIPFFKDAPAGSVLHRVMTKVGLDINNWFYTNAVICRPVAPAESVTENLQPNIEQINACNTRLKRMLRACSPKLVVILGSIAYRAFFGKSPTSLGDVTGWQTIIEDEKPVNYQIFVTFHPSHIARRMSGTREDSIKAQEGYLFHWTQIAERYKELNNAV